MKFTSGTITATDTDGAFTHALNGAGPDTTALIGVSGTYTSPTFVIQGRLAGGTVWQSLAIVNRKTLLRSEGSEAVTTDTAASWVVDCRGCDSVRIYASAGSSLAVTVEVQSGTGRDYGDSPISVTTVSTGASTLGVVSGASFVATSPTGAGVGYATGAGGAVTQGTSRTTGVTLSKLTGAITLVSAAGSTTPASFTVTNTAVAATDTIVLSQKSGTDKLVLLVTAVAAGSFQITFYTTGGTTTEQPVINFAVIKGVAA